MTALLRRALPWLLAVAALAGALWWFGASRYDAGYETRRLEDEAAATLQREANRGTAREAEEKEAVKTVYRDRFIVETVREIRHEAQNLSACLLTDGTVRMLNDAARCAAEPGQATCGAGAALPNP